MFSKNSQLVQIHYYFFCINTFAALRQENFLNVHKIYFFNANFQKSKKF